MKIEPISNGNLRIWLADEEIEEWGLAEGSPSYREGVRRLVRRALATVGRRPAARIGAEMIPVEGGCVVLVSPWVRHRRLPTVFGVGGEDALLEIYIRWRDLPAAEAPSLSVYRMEEDYRVVVYSDRPLSEGWEAVLCEYGYPVGDGEGVAAHTAEYGELLTALAPAPPTPADRDR